ncbi:unnamed protein product [Symbiodinium necroappetens]|uniref:Uncharacterized protein n=1 Tax=Symbiodinium necroappetens TaxID=1628268 RepID=A0A812S9B0_9DINO|nr:unnamed protein product [Symbiodinium necroappetens]
MRDVSPSSRCGRTSGTAFTSDSSRTSSVERTGHAGCSSNFSRRINSQRIFPPVWTLAMRSPKRGWRSCEVKLSTTSTSCRG